MQNAVDVLTAIRERGERGLPLEDVYRQLYKPDLYVRAYGRIYRNEGAMTRGTTKETVDGMSLAKIEAIIEALRFERYRWTPVRRVEIPKPKQPGKTRPLGIPTWSDKLLQEVMRSLLEAYYEPQFSDLSHGFRLRRGCHTALTTIQQVWHGTKWFIEGDIKGCFDNIDPAILLTILGEKIHDNRFLRLVTNLLQAGYMERWEYRPTLSGTPQGGVISPLLANIYLDRLDQFVEQTLLPAHTGGENRKKNLAWQRLWKRAAQQRKLGNWKAARDLEKEYQHLPTRDPNDPEYRRLRYLRYADDFLLGFAGPHAEAETIKEQLTTLLRDRLKLELSTEKTLITHATNGAARFLGYDIVTHHCDTKQTKGCRSINGRIGLRIPAKVLEARGALYQQERKHGQKPTHRPERIADDDFTTVARYQSEYRGYVQYYQLAENLAQLEKLRWIMEVSLTKTLAAKFQVSVPTIYQRYAGTIGTAYGPRKCLKATLARAGNTPLTAVFGGIPLRRNPTAILKDLPTFPYRPDRSELTKRLLAEECELCGGTERIEVHHIGKLADLQKEGRKEKPLWAQTMAARRRKTLVLCSTCHTDLHAGRMQKPHATG
jgi:group II intron reverse transcriptase/maturase